MLRLEPHLLVQPPGHLRHLDLEALEQAIHAQQLRVEMAARDLELERGGEAEPRGQAPTTLIATAGRQRHLGVHRHVRQVVLDQQALELIDAALALTRGLSIALLLLGFEGGLHRGHLRAHETIGGARDGSRAASASGFRCARRQARHRLPHRRRQLLEAIDLGGGRTIERDDTRLRLRHALVRE